MVRMAGLGVNGTLLSLTLSGNVLGDVGTLALMDILQRNGTLRVLDIWHVPLSQVCGCSLAGGPRTRGRIDQIVRRCAIHPSRFPGLTIHSGFRRASLQGAVDTVNALMVESPALSAAIKKSATLTDALWVVTTKLDHLQAAHKV